MYIKRQIYKTLYVCTITYYTLETIYIDNANKNLIQKSVYTFCNSIPDSASHDSQAPPLKCHRFATAT